MASLTYKCPNCGAPLTYQPGKDKSACDYCNSAFTLEELEAFAANQQTKEEEEHSHDHVDEKEDGSVMGYTCGSCGAEVVTDETTTATFCYYCHNPVILTERLRGDFKPDKIIPFAIDRKKAEAIFLTWAKSKRYVPKSFYSDSQLEKITGMYLPYWMADIKADVDIEGVGQEVNTWTSGDTEYTETKEYRIERKGDIEIDNIGELAFTKIDKPMIDSITPFREENAKAFSMAYLSGFFAEAYDKKRDDVQGEIQRRMERYTKSLIDETTNQYTSVDLNKEDVNYEILGWHYALFPAWVMTYKYLGKIYIYAINGQTGRAYGELPLDKKKLSLTSVVIGLVILVALILGGRFIW